MDRPDSSPTDRTSIKPVSSLRSRFENLGKDQPPTTPRSSSNPHNLDLPPANNQSRAVSPSPRLSLDTPRPKSFYPTNQHAPFSASSSSISPSPSSQSHVATHASPQVEHLQASKKRQPTPPRQRPVSMISPRPELPLVNVESPASPPKPRRTPNTSVTPPRPPSSPNSPSPSPMTSANHSRTPSRVTTPALEARMSAFLQAAHSNDPPSETEKRQHNGPLKSKPPPPPGPPPVNRAGKPKLSAMSASSLDSVDPFTNLAPRNGHVHTDDPSPFNTPPSSSDSATPADHFSPPQPAQSRTASIQIPSHHGYFPAQRPVSDNAREQLPNKPPRPVSQSLEAALSRSHTSRPLPSQDGTDESLPGLPPRPGRQVQSGRTSPVRQQRIPARRSMDMSSRPSAVTADPDAQLMPPPRRPSRQSALTQGFGLAPASTPTTQKPPAPAIPAPRRSIDHRREEPRNDPAPRPPNRRADDYDDPPLMAPGVSQEAPAGGVATINDYPNASQANRRPPQFAHRPWEIATGYDTKLFAVCGEYVCTTGYITRVFNLRTGESCLTLAHSEGVKITALVFKPTSNVQEEGQCLWLGTSVGDIYEIDIPTQSVITTKQNAHPRKEIVKLYRHASQLWSLDADGILNVWTAGREGVTSLETMPRSFRTTKGHSASIVVAGQLWIASGKAIYVFQPNASTESSFQVLQRPLQQDSAGDVTSAAIISSRADLIYFGHSDGKVSIYDRKDYRCVGLVNISPYKILSLTGAGDRLWAGYATGRIYVYDTSTTPWQVLKDWQSHDKPVCNIITDRQSLWKMSRLQVVSLGLDNMLRLWDGLLEEDWLETKMQMHDDHFSKFNEITAAVLTWNAGATKPTYLKNDQKDSNFFRNYLTSQDPPDIFVFGFQELVDLEDKKVTAKSFFKSKKKDPNEQEHVGHQYRAWRDHISRCIEDYLSAEQSYTLLHTSSMVGLFSCVFVKTSLRSRIKQVNATEIKRGMGGLHGNKGALIIRMIIDDSSLCLVNCHLAAGQTQTASRNNDAASILESYCLPEAVDNHTPGTFVGGGDGSMILDHELCIWNGDLNYRIDAMPRDTVVKAVKDRNLAKLLERDQLLLSRKRNPTFRLQVFQEMPITFAPTYKYNVGTDDYDSSEKKRAPAWCDRVLFRGMGRIKGEDYRRWEVRVSDHRPVSARFKMRIKKVDEQKRKIVWQGMEDEFLLYRDKVAAETKLDYLMNVLGLGRKEAVGLLK